MKQIFSAALLLAFIFTLISCGNAQQTDVWEKATYRQDTELGEGSKTVTVEVSAQGQTVVFTVKTERDKLGAALQELGLLQGEDSSYGLYVKKVNGIMADYDVDQSYWALYIDGEYAMTGVDSTDITEGVTYRLAYKKG